jgi:hypothetical protein
MVILALTYDVYSCGRKRIDATSALAEATPSENRASVINHLRSTKTLFVVGFSLLIVTPTKVPQSTNSPLAAFERVSCLVQPVGRNATPGDGC